MFKIDNGDEPRFKRSLGGFELRIKNSAPCSQAGTFLNDKRKNGRWYWYCYYDERGNLAWMNMRCPNKSLFDPVIHKCVVNLTSTTESTLTTTQTTLSTLTTMTLTTVESTSSITTSSATTESSRPIVSPVAKNLE